jgi:hypothetical protein
MSACLAPINFKAFKCKEKIFYKYVPDIKIYCNINKNKLIDIIKYTFLETCELSVFGYNNRTHEFWAKKFKNNDYLLHFTLILKSIDNNNSFIVISPLVGDDNEIVKLVSNINQIISLYKTTSYA